eukprot:gb/GECH01013650.1/.p1 GENE.gb/GECH01013650.1/~~gb/GECH01013650.1/.p1  ORF type:complete len:826 (+),score=257.73 gb/GECH01013650.1/:1-2478(+)
MKKRAFEQSTNPASREPPKKKRIKHESLLDKLNAEIEQQQKRALVLKSWQLQEELQEQKQETTSKEETNKKYKSTIDTFERQWNNLLDDLNLLTSRLDKSSNQNIEGKSSFAEKLINANFENIPSFDSEAANHQTEKIKQVMSKLVDSIVEQKNHYDSISQQLADTTKDPAMKRELVLHSLKEENTRLRQQNSDLQEKMNEMQTEQRSLINKSSEATSKYEREHAECKELRSSVSDLKERLHNEQMSLKFLRTRSNEDAGEIQKQQQEKQPSQSSGNSTSVTSEGGSSSGAAHNSSGKSNDAASNATDSELLAQMEDLRAVAESRLKELEQERERSRSLEVELYRTKDHKLSEEEIKKSHLYQSVDRRIQDMEEYYRQLWSSMDQRDSEYKQLSHQIHQEKQRFRDTVHSQKQEFQKMLNQRNSRIGELQSEVKQLRIELEQAQAARDGPQKTLTEYKTLIDKQQSELEKLRSRVKKIDEEADGNVFAILDAREKHTHKLEKALKDWQRRDASWREKEKQLHATIEGLKSKEKKETADLIESERSLKAQVEKFKEAAEEKQKLSDKVFGLTSELDNQKKVTKALNEELDEVNTAYDELSTQNQRLLKDLSAKDDELLVVAQQRMSTEQKVKLAQEEASTLNNSFKTLQEVNKKQEEALRAAKEDNRVIQEQLEKTQEELQATSQMYEHSERTLSSTQQSLEQFKSKIRFYEDKQKEGDSNLDNISSRLTTEQNRATKLEETCNSLRAQVSRMSKSGSGIDFEELESYKQMVTCSVCKDRIKDCVITRCFHVFCKDCVQANLQSRLRKCPACGERFGDRDVHDIYM